MPFRIGVTAALLVLAATGGVARAADHTVAVGDNQFAPSTLTIAQNDRVIWSNPGGGNDHNVFFTSGPAFDVPATPVSTWAAGAVQRVFDQPGTFTYVCQEHSSMTASITVNAAPGDPPGDPSPGDPPPGGPGPGQPGPGPGQPGPGAPGELDPLKVTFKVGDATPLAGAAVKLSGEVRPARDGRKVQIQRRGRGGSYRTIATTRLKDAGTAKSKFSITLRMRADAVLRVRIAGDDERATGLSRTRSIDVHRRGR
jgi:plastocyanin